MLSKDPLKFGKMKKRIICGVMAQPTEVFCKKGALRNLIKKTETYDFNKKDSSKGVFLLILLNF